MKSIKRFRVLTVLPIIMIMMFLMFCSTSSQRIKATAYDPVTIEARNLPGRLSDYPIYTYDWLSKGMSVTSSIRNLDFTQELQFFSTTTKELPHIIGGGRTNEDEIIEGFYRQIGFLSEKEVLPNHEYDEQDYNSIAGFYGVGTNTFVIVSDASPKFNPYAPVRFNDIVLVHELTHALQDMNFNLSRTINAFDNSTDSMLSFKSLIEGDATLTQYIFLMDESPKFKHINEEEKKNFIRRISDRFSSSGYGGIIETNLPDYNLRNALFIYHQGAGFVSQLYLAGGYDLVNKALSEKIPLSTEQIMHPVKYINNDVPSDIEIPLLSHLIESKKDGAWNRKHEDTLGEFNIYLLMDKNLSGKGMDASSIAEGWDGDRVEYFVDYSTNEDAMVWVTVWDTDRDALEFKDAYIYLMSKKRDANQISIKSYEDNMIVWEDTNNNISFVIADGRLVFAIEDIPQTSFDSIKEQFLSSKITIND